MGLRDTFSCSSMLSSCFGAEDDFPQSGVQRPVHRRRERPRRRGRSRTPARRHRRPALDAERRDDTVVRNLEKRMARIRPEHLLDDQAPPAPVEQPAIDDRGTLMRRLAAA